MKFAHKYKYGDIFWSPFCKNEKYIPMSYTVDGIDDVCLFVELGSQMMFYKWHCYSTQAECQSECDRLNEVK
jgi:hypothetical protein